MHDRGLKEGHGSPARLMISVMMQERVIGQADAVSAVARAMKRARSGLKDPRRPIAAMLFAGPTGVGKTKLTKVPLSPSRSCAQEALLAPPTPALRRCLVPGCCPQAWAEHHTGRWVCVGCII